MIKPKIACAARIGESNAGLPHRNVQSPIEKHTGKITTTLTNGVVERFYSTLKEQIIHGRYYRNLEELCVAVDQFIERYSLCWPGEKLGFKSPQQAFHEFQMKAAA